MSTISITSNSMRCGRMWEGCIRRMVQSWQGQPVIIISTAGACSMSTSRRWMTRRVSCSSCITMICLVNCRHCMWRSGTTEANCRRAIRSTWKWRWTGNQVRLMTAVRWYDNVMLVGSVKWGSCRQWGCSADMWCRASVKVIMWWAICLVVICSGLSCHRCIIFVLTAACQWRAGHVHWRPCINRCEECRGCCGRFSWCCTGNCCRQSWRWTNPLCCQLRPHSTQVRVIWIAIPAEAIKLAHKYYSTSNCSAGGL